MINKLAKLLFFSSLLLICPSHAEHDPSKGRYKNEGKYPVYSIPIRKENSVDHLDETDEKYFSARRPYALARPNPYYDKVDIELHRADPKLKNAAPFLIGGVNCDDTIQQAKSITGISPELLTERAKGHPEKSQFGKRKGPAWDGINNTHLRSSGDGFIKPDQNIRDLLLKDNKAVREMKLTHQKIAEPILVGIEALNNAIASGNRVKSGSFTGIGNSVGDEISFSYGGEEYSISRLMMGGAIKLFAIPKNKEEEKEIERKFFQRMKVRPPGTAWIGAGVQGSFFNDELFEDYVFTIKRKMDGMTLTKDMLTPHLIYRYGFYQGGEYRIDPKEVAVFFNLKGDQEKSWEEMGCHP